MSHIFSEDGIGESDKSLSEALAQAVQSSMGGHKFEGDHGYSLMIVVEGFNFDGKKYHVKLHVVIFDFELEHEDIYHQLEKDRKKYEKTQHMLLGHYYSALKHETLYKAHKDSFVEKLKHVFADHHPEMRLQDITLVSSSEFHSHLEHDMGYKPTYSALHSGIHMHVEEPTLTPGGFSSSSNSDKAA